eukprot:403335674
MLNQAQALNFLTLQSLYPVSSWLTQNLPLHKSLPSLLNQFCKQDFTKVVDTTKLKPWKFSEDVKIGVTECNMAVQIVSAVNVGLSKREQDDVDQQDSDNEDDENNNASQKLDKLESAYLDPKVMKEKKKIRRDNKRLMKLTLTDGFNTLYAIEDERLISMHSFEEGQALLLQKGVEVRRNIIMLSPKTVSYLGDVPKEATQTIVIQKNQTYQGNNEETKGGGGTQNQYPRNNYGYQKDSNSNATNQASNNQQQFQQNNAAQPYNQSNYNTRAAAYQNQNQQNFQPNSSSQYKGNNYQAQNNYKSQGYNQRKTTDAQTSYNNGDFNNQIKPKPGQDQLNQRKYDQVSNDDLDIDPDDLLNALSEEQDFDENDLLDILNDDDGVEDGAMKGGYKMQQQNQQNIKSSQMIQQQRYGQQNNDSTESAFDYDNFKPAQPQIQQQQIKQLYNASSYNNNNNSVKQFNKNNNYQSHQQYYLQNNNSGNQAINPAKPRNVNELCLDNDDEDSEICFVDMD